MSNDNIIRDERGVMIYCNRHKQDMGRDQFCHQCSEEANRRYDVMRAACDGLTDEQVKEMRKWYDFVPAATSAMTDFLRDEVVKAAIVAKNCCGCPDGEKLRDAVAALLAHESKVAK